jgi:hypothetical protein
MRRAPRLLAALLALTSVWAAGALSACSSNTQEGCLAGPCTGGAGGMGTGGGAGGAGAAATCHPDPQTGDFPCDVFAVVHQHCNPCHQDPPQNGAPFPLLTYADTQQVYKPGKLVFQQMYDQIQPGAGPRMPLGGSLTDAEFDTLANWLAACAPPTAAGTGCGCPGQGCN